MTRRKAFLNSSALLHKTECEPIPLGLQRAGKERHNPSPTVLCAKKNKMTLTFGKHVLSQGKSWLFPTC
jgi:hypothetical protein